MAEFTPTPGQALAISDRGGELLVSAAAGSGKTRVLIERLMGYILGENRAGVDSFLIITFTRAAAEQLRGKIGEHISELAESATGGQAAYLRRQRALLRRAQICTIDSFCVSLLRENAAALGLDPGFALCDEQRAAELKSTALENTLEAAYERAEPDFLALAGSVGAGRDDARLESLVLSLHEKLQSHARPERWVAAQKRDLDALPEDAGQTVWGRELIDGARAQLSYWRGVMRRLLDEVSDSEAAMKAYGASLGETAASLDAALAACERGWDALRAALPVSFPRLGALRSDAELRELVKSHRDPCKKALDKLTKDFSAPSAELLRDVRATAPAMTALLNLALEFDAEYTRCKRRRSLIDFADAEHLAAQLLTDEDGNPSPFALELSRRYTEVMVDEYQDVSRVQEDIVRAVSGGGRRLFMVGDVKQSIYRFRLADPTIFLDKYERFTDAPAPEGEPRRVFLSESFRSRGEVVAAVNSVFHCLMSRELGELDYDGRAELIAALPYTGSVPRPELAILTNPGAEDGGERPDKVAAEARYAARRMRELVEGGTMLTAPGGERPLGYGDIAVLLRSANVSGAVWRRELARMGVPVESGQSGGFFTAGEVEVILSLLSIIDNPRQDVQLVSVLRSALFGFTPDELTAIRLAQPDGELWDALLTRAGEDEKCRSFADTIDSLRDFARESEVSELISEIYSRLDCFAVCAALGDGEARSERLQRLAALAQEFESGAWRGLRRFNEWIERMRESGREPAMPAGESSGRVRIMSIHQSKGLEFPVVFLCETAKHFNEMDLRPTVLLHPELGLGCKVTDAARGIEYPTITHRAVAHRLRREQLSEELRLLYVAMTRARERLIMTCSLADPEKAVSKLSATAESPMDAQALLGMRSFSDWLITAAVADGGRTLDFSVVPEETETAAKPAPAVPSPDAPEASPSGEAQTGGLERLYSWRYAAQASVNLPSKVTATELKSLPEPDPESADLIARAVRPFRVPELSGVERELTAAERGTATHLALRYIELATVHSLVDARDAIDALVYSGALSAREAQAVDANSIYALAASELGHRMGRADKLWREFSFSLLRPAGELFPGAGDDEILLQGVVDCCFAEHGRLVVVDYKTDRIRPDDAAARAETYRAQLESYAWAMERITSLPVAERIIYFLRPGIAVSLPEYG